LNTAKAGRRELNGLVIIAHSDQVLDVSATVIEMENDGLELVALRNNSTTLVLMSSEGQAYSKSRLESIERSLRLAGFKGDGSTIEFKRRVETRIHLRAIAEDLAEEYSE